MNRMLAPTRAVAIALLVAFARTAVAQTAVVAHPAPAQVALPDSAAKVIERVQRDPTAVGVPSADSFKVGSLTIPAGTTVNSSVATTRGDIHVFGTVKGNAVAVTGDVYVHPGAHVTGNAISVFGSVHADGVVDGEMRTLGGAIGVQHTAVALSPTALAWRHTQIALGTIAILALIGLGFFIAGEHYLEGTRDAIETRFGTSLIAGLAGQLALAPVLLLICLALAITIIGLLLIPFAIVAFALAVAGFLTLGFLGVSLVAGNAFLKKREGRISPRGATLRALVIGLVIFGVDGLIIALAPLIPVAGNTIRAIAMILCWIAVSVGFGAALLSRGGTVRVAAARRKLSPSEMGGWATPTPVSGVVAARRPTPAVTRKEG